MQMDWNVSLKTKKVWEVEESTWMFYECCVLFSVFSGSENLVI